MEHTPGLSAERAIDDMVALFEELVSRVRIELLCALAQQPLGVTALAERMKLSMSLVSGHLARLAREDLVTHEVIGKTHLYRLGPTVSWAPVSGGRELGFRIGPDIRCLLQLTGAVLERLTGLAELKISAPAIVVPGPRAVIPAVNGQLPSSGKNGPARSGP